MNNMKSGSSIKVFLFLKSVSAPHFKKGSFVLIFFAGSMTLFDSVHYRWVPLYPNMLLKLAFLLKTTFQSLMCYSACFPSKFHPNRISLSDVCSDLAGPTCNLVLQKLSSLNCRWVPFYSKTDNPHFRIIRSPIEITLLSHINLLS